MKGDARGAPASDFEGKIDARKKNKNKRNRHTKRKVNERKRIAFERKRILYNIE